MNFLNDLRDPSKNSRSHHWSDRNKLVWDFCYERFLIFIDFAWVALRSHDQTLPTLIRYADESRRPPRSRWNETVWKGHYLKTNTNANNNLGQALCESELPSPVSSSLLFRSFYLFCKPIEPNKIFCALAPSLILFR